jgi:hypothetical protein
MARTLEGKVMHRHADKRPAHIKKKGCRSMAARDEAIRCGRLLEFLAEGEGKGGVVKRGRWPKRKTSVESGLVSRREPNATRRNNSNG